MDENIRFGIGVSCLLCSLGYVIGDLGGLLACAAFISIPWMYEIKERLNTEEYHLATCQLCGRKFRIRNQNMEFEYRSVGLCPLCLDSIFQYSKTVPEKPAN